MALPPGLESLMAAIPPLGAAGRTAPGPAALAPGGMSPPGAGPGAPPSAPGPAANIFDQVVNAQQSKAGGTDPQYFIDQTKQAKSVFASMLPKALLRYPGQVDRQIQNVLRAVDALEKALVEANQHQMAMTGGGAGGPIDFAGAQVGQPAGLPAQV